MAGRWLANGWPIVGQWLADGWPMVCQLLANGWTMAGQWLAKVNPKVNPQGQTPRSSPESSPRSTENRYLKTVFGIPLFGKPLLENRFGTELQPAKSYHNCSLLIIHIVVWARRNNSTNKNSMKRKKNVYSTIKFAKIVLSKSIIISFRLKCGA